MVGLAAAAAVVVVVRWGREMRLGRWLSHPKPQGFEA